MRKPKKTAKFDLDLFIKFSEKYYQKEMKKFYQDLIDAMLAKPKKKP